MEENTQKQTWVGLRHALAKQAHCTEKEAATFLDSLVRQLTLALQNEQSVRINNLGTFRLQAVAPRKSVHVGTGEPITIAGYNKLAFAPEASVKVSMNETATPKLVPDTDPIRKLGEQADEILDILADMGQGPAAVEKEPEVEIEAPKAEPAEEAEPIVEETPTEEPAAETDPAEPEVTEEVVTEETKEPQVAPAEPESKKEPKKKKSRTGLTILLTVIFFILLCVGAYFFLQHKIVSWMDSLREKTDNTEIVVTPKEEPVVEEVVVEEPVAEVPIAEETIVEEPKYDSFIATEEMHADSRLAWMAYRYWRKKDLWVYIYDANRDRISNPNLIKTGTPIRVPRLTKEQQDLNNPETQRFIEQILSEFR